jgi:hypothetical protein
LTYRAEQSLIDNHVPFQIIYDHHLDDLERYRALVLAGCEAMSEVQIKHVERYAQAGGKVCMAGAAGTHDEWMLPRKQKAFDGLSGSGIERLAEEADVTAAVRRLCGADLSLSLRAPSGVGVELTQEPGRRLLHLVNYWTDKPAHDVGVSLRVPASRGVKSVVFVCPMQADDVRLPFEVRAGRVEFTVPSVDIYGIVVVTSE